MNAEILAGITLVQLTKPGAPTICAGLVGQLDMYNATPCFGAAESALCDMIVSQLTRRYGIPYVACLCPDSKVPDDQAAHERAIGTLLDVLSGAEIITMATGILEAERTASLEQTLIDNDIIGTVSRVARGVEVTEETLAIDLIDKAGPGNSFLSLKHTSRHVRDRLHFPVLADRKSLNAWERDGSKDMTERARAKVKQVLASYQPEPLEEDLHRELDKYYDEIQKTIAREI
jgi:trimethylamine--corrinoid protein Co-methyltransferase